ncbi:MAG: monovalent cation:proton antiporter-2 (CPA2) family protein [Minwuiales bacterium]|nr:monovalent cation:proton antiporter-2 (CPA2) family protein [Minwuiales bacterium]
MSLLMQSAIYLCAAVVAVPLSKRLGLGAILGYLAAGIIIGPGGLGLIGHVEDVLHFAEFGVVLLLFVIGLELQPSRLWSLRRSVFGLGGAQVLITGGALAVGGLLFGLGLQTAILVGLILALSSTAFGLQILAEKKQLPTRHGRVAFAILLFQDLAVIPLLALIPVLGGSGGETAEGGVLLGTLKVVLAIAVLVVGGRYLLRYVVRAVAAARTPEVFTAMALLTVIAAALLMEEIGLSAALGAFLAGVLLADSEYRHEFEADIEPFKGLLLGLFFIAVGMSVNVGLIVAQPLAVVGLVLGLLAIKGAVLFGIARASGLNNASARKLAVVLPQGGEFAFVLFAVAVTAGTIAQNVSDLLIVVVSLTMAATPLAVALNDTIEKRTAGKSDEPTYEKPAPEENQVIIAGFGRFGQIAGRILRAKKIPFTALEISAEQVDFVKRFGNKVYYGDASRLDLLRAAKADQAVAFVLAIDDVEASLRTAETVKRHFPNLTIYARARNRQHAHRLIDLDVKIIRRETFHSSLELTREVLKGLGFTDSDATRSIETFRDHDVRRLHEQYPLRSDEEKMIIHARQTAEELEQLFEEDAAEDEKA